MSTPTYDSTGVYYVSNLTVGRTYTLTTTGTELYVICGTLSWNEAGTPVLTGGVTLGHTPNVPYEFVANATTLFFGSVNNGLPVNATLTTDGLDLGSAGIRLDLMQERLHHFRMSGRHGRSVALELVNTQGRVRWQGWQTGSRPGRQRSGVQL